MKRMIRVVFTCTYGFVCRCFLDDRYYYFYSLALPIAYVLPTAIISKHVLDGGRVFSVHFWRD